MFLTFKVRILKTTNALTTLGNDDTSKVHKGYQHGTDKDDIDESAGFEAAISWSPIGVVSSTAAVASAVAIVGDDGCGCGGCCCWSGLWLLRCW